MRLIQLVAENFKRIKAVDITFGDGVTILAGLNGHGKSSATDALWAAFGGKEAIPGQPVRKGQDKAKITVGIGEKEVELVIKRTIPKDGPATLIIESPEGARYPSPQAMLDSIWNGFAVDPDAFGRMPPKEQAALLRKVAKLDIDVDEIDRLNKIDYDQRTIVNRDAKNKRAQAGTTLVKPEGATIDESALVDQLQKAATINADIETRKERRETANATIKHARDLTARNRESAKGIVTAAIEAHKLTVDNGKAELERALKAAQDAYTRTFDAAGQTLGREEARAIELEKEAAGAEDDAAQLEKRLAEAPALPEAVDVTELRTKIDAAKAQNKAIETYTQAKATQDDLNAAAKTLEEQSKALTTAIDAREKEKTDAIKNATMPVEGLGFADGGVTYQDLPYDQASQAERIRVNMAIAFAANPKLNLVCIRDGSLLDDQSLALVAELTAARKGQVIVEKVDGSGKVGIVFEDGLIVSDPESRQAALEIGK